MKKIFFILLFILPICFCSAQVKQTYESGEWFQFRIHYGWFNACYATLKVEDDLVGNTPIYHFTGKGKSTGLLDLFFSVDDTYESYIAKESELPFRFIRQIDEGGYTKNKIIYFNHTKNSAKVKDIKHNSVNTYDTEPNVQDMLSVLYYLRNQIDSQLKEKGDSFSVNMFFDQKNYKFKTVYLGDEVIKTKFGKVKCMKLRPYVQAGRVFKKQESLTFWITADKNKIPIKIKAKLSVGSLTADLDAYKNLKYPFEIIMK